MSDKRDLAVSSQDYDTIEAAVMATERGRWFLKEFARRNRHVETQGILEALARIEERLASSQPIPLPASPPPQPTPELGLAHAELEEILLILSEAEEALSGEYGTPADVAQDIESTNVMLGDILEALKAVADTLIAQDAQDKLASVLARRLQALDAVAQEQTRVTERIVAYLEATAHAKSRLLALQASGSGGRAERSELRTQSSVALDDMEWPSIHEDQARILALVEPSQSSDETPTERPAVEPPIPILDTSVAAAALSALPDPANDQIDHNSSSPIPEDDIFADEDDMALSWRDAAGELDVIDTPSPYSIPLPAHAVVAAQDRMASSSFDEGAEKRNNRHDEFPARQVGVRSPALIRSLAELDRLTSRERLALFT